jgi:glyoxylase-like metal-dependent hydrolase (beta-lactamase superfamily II)
MSKQLLLAATLLFFEPSRAATAQNLDWDKIEIFTQRVAPNFYSLTATKNVDPLHPDGAGGRVGVYVGADGIFMVDASYPRLSAKVLKAIRDISKAPIKYLANTHEHRDHVSGNPNFAKEGAVIFAREEVRSAMIKPLPPDDTVSTRDPARLPIVTYGFGPPVKIWMNDETVELIPVRNAHTDGDTMIKFDKSDVIMVGDFYRNYGYPYIDLQQGGSVDGTIEALSVLEANSGPNTKLLAGHGTMASQDDVKFYRKVILDIKQKVLNAIREGKSRSDVLAARLTAPYDAEVKGGLDLLPDGKTTTADRFVAAVYDDLKQLPKPQ